MKTFVFSVTGVLIGILVFLPPGQAAEKENKIPKCGTPAVTRNCDFFRERSGQPMIRLKDGTQFLNPLYRSDLKPGPSQGPSTPSAPSYYGYEGAGVEPAFEKFQNQQAEVLEALDGSNFSAKSKLMLAALGSGLPSGDEEVQLQVPWPLEGTDVQSVQSKVLRAELQNRLKPEAYARVSEIFGSRWQGQVKLYEKAQKEAKERFEKIRIEKENREKEERFWNGRKARVKELFDYAKRQVLQIVSRGKSFEQLPAEQQNMVRRIERVTLTDLSSSETAASAQCRNRNEDAFYMPFDASVSVCPGLLGNPDATLLFILGHEIAHSIDPCRLSQDIWSVDSAKIAPLLTKDGITKTQKENLNGLIAINHPVHSGYLEDGFDRKIFDRLLKDRIITKKIEGIRDQNYPFRDEMKCLIAQAAYGNTNKAAVQSTVERFKSIAKAMDGEDRKTFGKSIQRFQDSWKKHPHCVGTLQSETQTPEIMSDMIGTLVLEKYFADHPPESEEEKTGALSFFIRDSAQCAERKPSDVMPILSTREILQTVKHLSDSHPVNEARIAHLILGSPALAKLYRCEPVMKKSCFAHLSILGETASVSKGGVQ